MGSNVSNPEKILSETSQIIHEFQNKSKKNPQAVHEAFEELANKIIDENRALSELKTTKDQGTFSISLNTLNDVISGLEFLSHDKNVLQQVKSLETARKYQQALAAIQDFAENVSRKITSGDKNIRKIKRGEKVEFVEMDKLF